MLQAEFLILDYIFNSPFGERGFAYPETLFAFWTLKPRRVKGSKEASKSNLFLSDAEKASECCLGLNAFMEMRRVRPQ